MSDALAQQAATVKGTTGREERKIIFASSLGTVFEWYDFFLYGALATVLSKQFFAGVNDTTAFIFALMAFAAGFDVCHFALDVVEQHFVQGEWALEQFVQASGLAEACDFHEQLVHVLGDLFVGGENTQIGVKA